MRTHKVRQRISFSDASLWLGLALVFLSVGGLLVSNSSARASSDLPEGKVIREVAPVFATVTPLPAQAVQLTPSGMAPSLAAPTTSTTQPALSAPALPIVTLTPSQPTTSAGSSPTAQPDAGADSGAGSESFLVPGAPPPTAVPLPQELAPQRIIIPAINLDAAVIPAGYQLVQIDGQVYQQWDAPNGFVAGWQQTSAYLGVPGNTVLNGHHNIFGKVFGRLIDLKEGDTIEVRSGDWIFSYVITNKMILPERGEPLSVRLDNARWLLPTSDERLTLVTCWPAESNTHRLFIVARPVGKRLASSGQGP